MSTATKGKIQQTKIDDLRVYDLFIYLFIYAHNFIYVYKFIYIHNFIFNYSYMYIGQSNKDAAAEQERTRRRLEHP